jgi:hypothetical protein
MGIQEARYKERINLRRIPKEMAKSEIRIMKQKERYEDRRSIT